MNGIQRANQRANQRTSKRVLSLTLLPAFLLLCVPAFVPVVATAAQPLDQASYTRPFASTGVSSRQIKAVATDTERLISADAERRLALRVKRLAKLALPRDITIRSATSVISPGSSDPRVALVRRRIAQLSTIFDDGPVQLDGTGLRREQEHGLKSVASHQASVDSKSNDTRNANTYYDITLQSSVEDFQRRYGLLPDGRIGEDTIAALNMPIRDRLYQLRTSLTTMRRLQRTVTSSRYVLVNIPGLTLQAVRNNTVELHSTVIVGRPERATPVMSASIRAINIHPAWHVPASIVRSDLFPKFRTDPDYFRRRNFKVYSAGATSNRDPIDPHEVLARGLTENQVRLVQEPGPSNALGRIRIDMPNNYSVFLHDTPIPRLFGWPGRLFSAGCVRVARIVELAAWLIDESGTGDLPPVTRALRQPEPSTFRLKRKLPVHFVYLTAWVDSAGQVQFRPDVYQRHQRAASRI